MSRETSFVTVVMTENPALEQSPLNSVADGSLCRFSEGWKFLKNSPTLLFDISDFAECNATSTAGVCG